MVPVTIMFKLILLEATNFENMFIHPLINYRIAKISKLNYNCVPPPQLNSKSTNNLDQLNNTLPQGNSIIHIIKTLTNQIIYKEVSF